MTPAFGRLPDDSAPDPATRPHLASWYTPGLSDALGDRLLMFDNTTASPLELLRFKPEFSRTPGFEKALRQRVDDLAAFEHESLGTIRAVKRLGDRDDLALVSNQVVGRRLSEVLGEVRSASLALELIRQLTPVLAALHERGIAHGAITPDRIIITPEGGIVLIEHVLGSALDALQMSCGWMRTELGIAVPSGDGHMPLDARSDIVQLGFVALSLAAGQRLEASIYPEKVGDALAAAIAAGEMPAPLRQWLERALHLTWPPFASGLDAADALLGLPQGQDRSRPAFSALPARPTQAEAPRGTASNVVSIRPFPEQPASDRTASAKRAEIPEPEPVVEAAPYWRDERVPVRSALEPPPFLPPPPRAAAPQAFTPDLLQHIPPDPASPLIPVEAPPAPFFPDENDLPLRGQGTTRVVADQFHRGTTPTPAPAAAAQEKDQPAPRPEARPTPFVILDPDPARNTQPLRSMKWLPVAMIAAAVVGGIFFSGALSRDVAEPPAAVATAPPPAASPETGQTSPTPTARATAANAANRRASGGRAASPSVQRTGAVRFTSPVELEVFENGTRIGSTSGALTLAGGRHTLTLVNEALGYTTTQRVDVVAGRGTVRAVTLPQGRLSINATPWALVSIDGKPAGETPLANLSVPIGTHEITFRHPLLGERREIAVVKADGVTRVFANLNR